MTHPLAADLISTFEALEAAAKRGVPGGLISIEEIRDCAKRAAEAVGMPWDDARDALTEHWVKRAI